jgi:hypothetical protein
MLDAGQAMKLTLATPILFVAITTVSGQVKHAPRVAQCQADKRLWLSQLSAKPLDTNLPDFNTLTGYFEFRLFSNCQGSTA